MPEMQFPIDPPRFVAMPNPTRNRILLISDANTAAPIARQVATLPADFDVQELVAALNNAAWAGDRSDLGAFEKDLPAPVRESLRQTISELPPTSQVALGNDGLPLRAVTTIYLKPQSAELDELAEAAATLGVQVLFENALDEDGHLEIQATVLSGEPDYKFGDEGSWWPLPDSTTIADRRTLDTANFTEITSDQRWETNNVRAYTAWVPDDDTEDSARTAMIVVEYLDTALEPNRNYRIFLDTDIDEDDPLTPRNRFVLWQALWFISSDLDAIGDDFDPDLSMVYEDMPIITRNQPSEWWRKLGEVANELCEAARQADFSRLVPRTPAEEALIALATRDDYVAAARDQIADFGFQKEYDQLPHAEYDDDFGEILPDLTGDTDILMLWSPRLDGVEQSDDATNEVFGIGDYSPSAWHTRFSG